MDRTTAGGIDPGRTAIIHRVRTSVYVPRSESGRTARSPRPSRARAFVARVLRVAGWTLALVALGTLLGFIAFGVTLLSIDPSRHHGNPHVIIDTPAPMPVVRR